MWKSRAVKIQDEKGGFVFNDNNWSCVWEKILYLYQKLCFNNF